MARLSIIIPALNEAGCIARTLRALQPLRRRGAEVIVVDGGSSDATVELSRPYADRVLCGTRGRAAQMNAGAARACGEIIAFLHADTVLPPQADHLIAEALRDGKRVWGRFDVRIEGRHALLPVVAWLMNARSRLSGIATGDQCLFMRRTAFDAVSGFPALPLMEDIAMCKRLKRHSRPACVSQRATTSGRRWEERGVVRTILLMWWLRLRFSFGASVERLAKRYA